MFLELAHTRLSIFQFSQKLALESYAITKTFPIEEKYAMVQQIRRASLSVHLNIAEGCSRKSITERKRFFEIARGSVIEIDAALDIAVKLRYCSFDKLDALGEAVINTFRQLTGLMH